MKKRIIQQIEKSYELHEDELNNKGFTFCREICERQKDGLERVFEMYKNFNTFKSAILYYELTTAQVIDCIIVFYQE